MVPRGCFTELLRPQLKEISAGRKAVGWHLESLLDLPAGLLGTWAKAEDPLEPPKSILWAPQTCTSAQRHKLYHLASGRPPTTPASRKGLKVPWGSVVDESEVEVLFQCKA